MEEEKPIVGYGPLSAFLIAQGYPLSRSTLSKYCSPAEKKGPPSDGLWGQKPIFRPSVVLKWAQDRISTASRVARKSASASQTAL
jgi:hypothetical protein